jgi:hypothetical protein
MESALLASTDDVVDFDSEDEALPLESFELALVLEFPEELPGAAELLLPFWWLHPAKIKLAKANDENKTTHFVLCFIKTSFSMDETRTLDSAGIIIPSIRRES